jgi:hypothetical protein
MSAESPGRASSPPRRMPDFFIVGHAKSGTTALYEMLRSHPQVYMPDLKETLFFARELHPDPPGSRPSASDEHPRTLEEYLSLFDAAAPEQRAGEASPSYIRSLTAAGRIAQLRPDARIVAIFREPASFLYSLHLQLLQARVETEKDLGRAMALEDARRTQSKAGNTPIHQGLMYSEHVRYVEQLERYRAAFPSEQLLILIYDDFRADNDGTMRRLLRFLEVDDTAAIEVLEANPTVAIRSPRIDEVVRSLTMGRGSGARAAKTLIKAVTPRRWRRGALVAQRRAQTATPDPPDERLMLELRRRFKGEVLALGEYLDRDLVTLWGYDGID